MGPGLTFSDGWNWAYRRLADHLYTVAAVNEMLEGGMGQMGPHFKNGAKTGIADYLDECTEKGEKPYEPEDD